MIYSCYPRFLTRLFVRILIVGIAVVRPVSVRAQAMVGGPYSASIYSDHLPDSQSDKFSGEFQGDGLLSSASFGMRVFDHVQAGSGSDSVGMTQIQSNLDPVSPQALIFGSSYDPFKTFDTLNGSAARFGLASRPDDVLRGGPAVYPEALWMGTTADTDTKGGNHFEAGMTARFSFGRKTRYPVTITFPVYMALGDEQYFLGPHFGYITAGINLRVPLSFIPSRYGRWSAGSSADFCYYGTNATEFVRSIGVQIPKLAAALNVEL